ncbi:MAG: S8 family peptidase [Gemmatimonadaceae bacterium]|nr:S8 family peptidase [Gemmatimonadaceae bacterium]
MRPISRLSFALLGTAALAACADTTTQPADARLAAATGRSRVPTTSDSTSTSADPTDYIVTLADTTADPDAKGKSLTGLQKGLFKRSYKFALKGFVANLTPAAAEALARTAGVTRVEADGPVRINDVVTANSWGLDRIDQRALPLDGMYNFTGTASNVRAYIIDTGILTSHEQFVGRTLTGFSAFGDNNPIDCNGHGTHVAGTVGGNTMGVARGVTLIPVRVLDCSGSGTWSGVIAGIDWVTQQKTNNKSIPMVANMSLGGGYIQSVNDAVTKSISAGVVFAVAAGNESQDACNVSPAATPNAITVAASESGDNRAGYSNFGSCVDIFAPGTGITSSWIGANNAYAGLSGTSMATPHVTGVAALILGAYPTYTADQVRSSMLAAATPNVITDPAGSPNMLLSTLFTAAVTPAPAPIDTTTTTTPTQPPPPPPAPVAITLSITKQVSKNNNTARLLWSGATTTNVDVYRNGTRIWTTANDGSQNDSRLAKGSYIYRVCNAGSTTCSPDVGVTF